jgi:hypothetical protein
MSSDDSVLERMVEAYQKGYDRSQSAPGRPTFGHEMGVLAACETLRSESVRDLESVAWTFGQRTWDIQPNNSSNRDDRVATVYSTVLFSSKRGSAIPTSPYPGNSSVPTTPLSPSYNWGLGTGPRHVDPRHQDEGWVQRSPTFPKRTSAVYTSPPVSPTQANDAGLPLGHCWIAPYDHSQGTRSIDEVSSSPTSNRSSLARRLSSFGKK